jgi:hypothetical protein
MIQNETFLDIQKELQTQLKSYLEKKGSFESFLGIKNIIATTHFRDNLTSILEELSSQDEKIAQGFKLYLQTVIVNMQTKIAKYKKSIYFDDENIKDIQNQGYLIPFYIDDNNYVLLGIAKEHVN